MPLTCAVRHAPKSASRAGRPCPTPRSLLSPNSASIPPSRRTRSLLLPIACAACPTEPRPVLVVLTMVVLAHRRWCWWSSRAAGSHPDAWNRLASAFPMLQNACLKCFRCFRNMFKMFYMDVAMVVFGCCTCYNDYTRMLQEFVQNVSSVSDACCECFI